MSHRLRDSFGGPWKRPYFTGLCRSAAGRGINRIITHLLNKPLDVSARSLTLKFWIGFENIGGNNLLHRRSLRSIVNLSRPLGTELMRKRNGRCRNGNLRIRKSRGVLLG